MGSKRRFILSHHRSPGDLVCLTALMRDIHVNYPGEFETDFNTTVTPIWQNNPHITRLWNHNEKAPQITAAGTKMVACQYGRGIREQNHETIHFCSYFHRDFERQTGIKVPLTVPYGDLHLSHDEKTISPVTRRYWLLLTGGKSDFTIKVWHTEYFQEVTRQLGEMGLGVVQTGAAHTGHWHPKLTGDHVVDLCGWGGFREFAQQIQHADGIICGVTAAMHMAAALHKPCVVIAGGREAWWWEAYVNQNKGFGPLASGKHPMPHRFLHTIGLLDCCAHVGCWKNKVVPTGNDRLICKRPVMTPQMPIAECMKMITPEHVMAAVRSYYTDGSLPPISLAGYQDGNFAKNPVETPISDQKQPENAIAAENQAQAGEICVDGVCRPGPVTHKRLKTSASITIPRGVPIVINPKARITTAAKKPMTRPGQAAAYQNDDVVDHPAVGGKVTIFVLFYGDFFDLHKKCLTSLLATVQHRRMDLRVGSNALGAESLALIEEYVAQGFITKHYRHETNDYKYPVMREMFWDDSCPITTKWVLWFDDDSTCDVETNWFNILATHIAQHHKGRDAHMIGANFVWSANERQRAIMASRPWYKNRPWRDSKGQGSPNGNRIIFAVGGFWALTLEALRAADIPDLGTGLTHTGGDWQIGEQLYQAGYGIKQFNGQKQFVRTSSVPRRGVVKPTIDQVGHASNITPQPSATPSPQQPVSPTRNEPLQTPPAAKVKPAIPSLRIVDL